MMDCTDPRGIDVSENAFCTDQWGIDAPGDGGLRGSVEHQRKRERECRDKFGWAAIITPGIIVGTSSTPPHR